jgi:hypothetical protein
MDLKIVDFQSKINDSKQTEHTGARTTSGLDQAQKLAGTAYFDCYAQFAQNLSTTHNVSSWPEAESAVRVNDTSGGLSTNART